MKRLICALVVLVMSIGIGTSVFAEQPITVKIKDTPVVIPDQEPVKLNDRVLVPMRAIFEALGATVVWNDINQTAVGQKAGKQVQITVNSTTVNINGKITPLDQPAILMNDRVLVPVRVIAESFGAKVGWDDATWTVLID